MLRSILVLWIDPKAILLCGLLKQQVTGGTVKMSHQLQLSWEVEQKQKKKKHTQGTINPWVKHSRQNIFSLFLSDSMDSAAVIPQSSDGLTVLTLSVKSIYRSLTKNS